MFFTAKNLPNCRESRRKDVNMSEFKVIETQEELDTIVKARIAREREKYQDYDQLKSRVEELEGKETNYQATIEKLKDRETELSTQLESVNGELTQTKLQTAKQRIATEFGLPLDLADRLKGEDEEGFKADAERLASYMAPKQPTPPVKSNEPNVDPIHAALSSMVD